MFFSCVVSFRSKKKKIPDYRCHPVFSFSASQYGSMNTVRPESYFSIGKGAITLCDIGNSTPMLVAPL
jgi:hypothetical protein